MILCEHLESAFKEINEEIKGFYIRKPEMNQMISISMEFFCSKTPLIILDELVTESGRNVQEGYGHIFAGSMQGIRNPSAHANLTISGEKAMHLLFLASLLMFTIDDKLK